MQRPIITASLFSLLFAYACSSTTSLDIMLHETDLGAVYLERATNQTRSAAHPLKIQPTTMTHILRGITVQEESGLLGSLTGRTPEPVRVFTDDQIHFLVPLLVEGLTKAASDQHVGFRLGPAPAAANAPKGTMYAYNRSLYVTLPWLSPISRHGAGGRRLSKTLTFTPKSAKRPSNDQSDTTSDIQVIIDYEFLASQPPIPPDVPPAPTLAEQSPQGADTQLRMLQEQMRQKNEDLEGLKKELQNIRQQLTDPSTSSKRSHPASKPLQEPK